MADYRLKREEETFDKARDIKKIGTNHVVFCEEDDLHTPDCARHPYSETHHARLSLLSVPLDPVCMGVAL